MAHIPFLKSVDLQGILEDMVGANYVHGHENEVYYYSLHVDEEGMKR